MLFLNHCHYSKLLKPLIFDYTKLRQILIFLFPKKNDMKGNYESQTF